MQWMMGLERLCGKAKDDNYQISSLISYVGVEYLIDKQYEQKKQGILITFKGP